MRARKPKLPKQPKAVVPAMPAAIKVQTAIPVANPLKLKSKSRKASAKPKAPVGKVGGVLGQFLNGGK